MAFLIGGANSAADTGYEVANSCRFNDGDSPRCQKDLADGHDTAATISLWFKRCTNSAAQTLLECYEDSSNYFRVRLEASNEIQIRDRQGGSDQLRLKTNALIRDPSAWYSLIIIIDTTDGTAADRCKVYINGTRVTNFGTETTYGSSDTIETGNADSTVNVGGSGGSDNYLDGYLAEVVFLDGVSQASSGFGEFDEDSPTIWKPKDVSGLTFGTNGFYLDFEASDNLGNDANGGTDLTEANLAATDQSSDSPTNNFATMNPLIIPTSGSSGGLSEGNLNITTVVQNCGTIFINKDSTGKWYWECKVISGNSSGKTAFGFSSDKSIRNDGGGTWAAENTLWLYSTDGSRYGSNAGWTGSAGDTYTDGDIIGMALDLNGDSMTFYKNGSSQFTISSLDISGTAIVPWVQNEVSGCVISVNFGNPPYANSSSVADGNGYGAFEYEPPSGHYALCTKNLAEYG